MKPKEKAEELITKFMEINNVVYTIVKRRVLINIAKRNALIAVDELIYETQFEVPNVRQKYWQQVKKELELL
jgi:hypothetical protein